MSQMFKTGTFGLSTVFSTPCDASIEEQQRERNTKKYQNRVTLDDYYFQKQQMDLEEEGDLSKYKFNAKQSYDDIFESYTKIWNNPINQDQYQQKYSNDFNSNRQQISINSQKSQFQNYLRGCFNTYSLPYYNKEIITLGDQFDQLYIDEMIQKKSNSLKMQAKMEQVSLINLLKDKILQSYQNHQTLQQFEPQISINSPLLQQNQQKNSTVQSTNGKVSNSYQNFNKIRQPNFYQNIENVILSQQDIKINNNTNGKQLNKNDNQSYNGISNNCTRAKDDDDEFDLSFDEDILLDLNQEGLDIIEV